ETPSTIRLKQASTITEMRNMGSSWARMQTWDGKKWVMHDAWYEADMQIIKPMVREAAAKYAKEHNIAPRDCAKEMTSGS
nr:hypothetical protein [Thiomonas arsenitoxydans]